MDADDGAFVGDGVGVAEAEIPKFAGFHDDAGSVELKVYCGVGADGDVEADGAIFPGEFVVAMFFNLRARGERHEAGGIERERKRLKHFLKVGAFFQERGICEVSAGGI